MAGAAPNPIVLAEWLRRRAALAPDRPAVTDDDGSVTDAGLEDRVERLSAILAEGGIGPGDRVAHLAFNSREIVVALFAASRLGAIYLPLNFRLTPRELSFIIGDAGAHTLLADEENAAKIDAARPSLPCRRFLSFGGARQGWEALGSRLGAGLSIPPVAPVGTDDVAVLM